MACVGSPKYVVAPMVDHSDLAFRMLTRRYGAQLVYTQMFNANMFVSSEEYRRDNFRTCGRDRPLIVQFAGHEPVKLCQECDGMIWSDVCLVCTLVNIQFTWFHVIRIIICMFLLFQLKLSPDNSMTTRHRYITDTSTSHSAKSSHFVPLMVWLNICGVMNSFNSQWIQKCEGIIPSIVMTSR